MKMLINAGIEEVVYFGDYPDELASEIVREAGLRNSQVLSVCRGVKQPPA